MSSTRRDLLKTAAATAASTVASTAHGDFAPVRSLPIIVSRAVSTNSDYKQRAIADYVANMKSFGGSLARHGRHLLRCQDRQRKTPWQFDIVVIGSGYGGAICAARLAQHKHPETRLAVLERGREWIPGTFPDTFHQNLKESRFRLLGPRKNTIDNPVGLINVMQNDEVNILSGSGLGGSSLINANVAIRPDRECFEQMNWPAALRDRSLLDPYFDLAAWELGAESEANDASPKSRSQRLAAKNLEACGAKFENANVTLTRGAGCERAPIINRHGMRQRACIDCGDCNSGCNVGAKNTLAANYLPEARRNGAELYTHTEVVRVEKIGAHYRIHFKSYLPNRWGQYKPIRGSITSRVVILGAGSIGSNEILLRSRGCGMQLSDRVGYQWTMNGDALGFVRKSRYLTNTSAFGAYQRHRDRVGPTIQTNLTYPNRELSQRVLIQDGSVTKSYANILSTLMMDMDMDETLPMLGMGHDGAGGRVTLRAGGHGKVTWRGIKDSGYRKLIRQEFARVAQAHGGEYRYLRVFGDNFITVHPLGGCAMADDPLYGVVDDRGRVFDAGRGGMIDSDDPRSSLAPVHHGLYVADGAIIPNSIGCNPLLTIAALAERIAQGIVSDPIHRDLFNDRRSV